MVSDTGMTGCYSPMLDDVCTRTEPSSVNAAWLIPTAILSGAIGYLIGVLRWTLRIRTWKATMDATMDATISALMPRQLEGSEYHGPCKISIDDEEPEGPEALDEYWVTAWHCAPPAHGTRFTVTSDRWDDDGTILAVRHIYAWRGVT